MQDFFAPTRKFFRRGVIAITPRPAPVEQRDVQESLMESAFVALRRRAESARADARLDRLAERPREFVKTRRRSPGKVLREIVPAD
jgi:hypothetical protein